MKTGFVLLLLGAAGHGATAMAQSAGVFSVAGNMTTPRCGHTATLVTSGKVLIAGGFSLGSPNGLATAELYDPATGIFTPTGAMTTPRSRHTATLLPDGKVLIAGGYSGAGDNLRHLNTAEVYDPSTGNFAPTGNTVSVHECLQASLLRNGKVLLSGGSVLSDDHVPGPELYDPTVGTFAGAGEYSTNPSGFNTCQGAASALLPDGKVLIVWEEHAAEIYDADTGSFTRTGNPLAPSYNDGLPTATLLMNGKILVAGGAWDGDLSPVDAELYDARSGTFTATGKMITGHVAHTATLLPDGTVLLAGSFSFPGELTNAELYNPATGTFAATGSLITPRGDGQTATLLNDGRVLITGGFSIYPAITANAEIYHPVTLVPAPLLFSVSGDGQGQGAILHPGSARIVGAGDPAIPGEAVEIYGTGLQDGSVIPPQVTIGGRLAEVLWFGNTPGFQGLNQINVRLPGGIESGPAVPVRLIYLDRPSNVVTLAVQ